MANRIRPFRQTAAQARAMLRARRIQKRNKSAMQKKSVSRKKAPRTATLNQLIKTVPDANVPVIVFPNVSSFRSITNKLGGTKKKITAAALQRGGGLIPL